MNTLGRWGICGVVGALAALTAACGDGGGIRIVDAAGNSRKAASLAEAVAEAVDGETVVLTPGTYPGNLRLNRSITLQGDGPSEEIIIESAEASGIRVEGGEPTIRGLTVRCAIPTFDEENAQAAIFVKLGDATIENCLVSAPQCVGLWVSGASGEAHATLRNSRVMGSGHIGVLTQEGATTTIEDCDIVRNGQAGVYADGPAEINVRRSRIRGGGESGLVYQNGATGTVEDCEISRNGDEGFAVGGGANPLVRRCVLVGGATGGINVFRGGHGVFEDCVIRENGRCNVYSQEGGFLTMRRCEVTKAGQVGAYILTGGTASFEECVIRENTNGGVDTESSSSLSMISCIIADNPFQGVTVDTGSSATLVSCEVLRNAQHGVGVHSSSRVTLDDCLIADNGEEGIHGCDHSVVNARNTRIRNNRSIGVNNFYYTTGLYEDCTIESTSGWNVRVRGCADPTFVRCRMVGADTGVCVLHLGRGTFRDCEITGSAVDGVWIEDLAYPVLERCRVENSGKSGMVCLIRAHPTVTNCTMIDNAWSGAVLNGADVDIIQGVYADNGHFGVRAMNGSTGSVQSCDLTGNRYGPARVDRDSRVALSNSQVSQPKEPPPTPSDPVTISLDGDGDFSSISTALQLIPAGSTLALRPGTYTERLVIEVPVTIIGDGASDEVVLSCDRGVMVRSAGVTLRGLTLLSPEAEPGQTHNALQVLAAVGGITILDSGETASLPTLGVTRSEIAMVVENCRLQSATSAALFAEGNTVSVAIRGSEIFDSGGSGIYVRDGARLVTENCRVTGNAMPGVSIQSQAQAQVRDSVITSNGNHGVYAWEGGHAVIEGCDLRGNSPGPTFADQASRIDQQNNQL